MSNKPKHIVIDARIRRASTGRPVDRLLHYLPSLDSVNQYTILVEPNDPITFKAPNFTTLPCAYKQFSFNPIKQLTFSAKLYGLSADLVFFTMTGQAPLFYFGRSATFTHDLTMLRYARAGRLPQWLHRLRMVGYRLLFWKGNRFARQIFVPSQFVKDDLIDNYSGLEHKITITHEASEPPLKVKAEKLAHASLKKPFIMHVGSPFPHKNIKNLIKAFEILSADYPELQLVLAGKKEYYFNQLEEWLSSRAIKQKVVITGFISDNELKWLYQNAEAYVLPSLSEGFGLPGLEAMAHGCPLISSDATCLPEIYGEAAEYFDPESPRSIADATAKVLGSSSYRERLIKKGYEQLTRYSWEKMAKEINSGLHQIL